MMRRFGKHVWYKIKDLRELQQFLRFKVRKELDSPPASAFRMSTETTCTRKPQKTIIITGTAMRAKRAVPSVPRLRDKDRFLWGRSAARQLVDDLARGFSKARK